MTGVEDSTIINAPVGSVWAFVSDFDAMTQWGPGVIEVKWQRPVGVGSTVVVTTQLLGRRTANMQITQWEPNRRIAVEITSGGAKVRAVITMEPLDGGRTSLSRSTQTEIGGLLRLLQPYISHRAKKERAAFIDNVKRLLEARSPGAEREST